MANLWEETNRALEAKGKSFNDVVAICGNDFQIIFKSQKRILKSIQKLNMITDMVLHKLRKIC